MGLMSFIKAFIDFKEEPVSTIICPIDISEYKSIRYDAVCPKCGFVLGLFPERSKKCKSCNSKMIRVKLPETDIIVLLNEDEGTMLKYEVDKYYNDKYEKIKKADPDYVENEKGYYLKVRKALSDEDYHKAKMLTSNYITKLLNKVEEISSENPEICTLGFKKFEYEILEYNQISNIRKIKISAGINNCKKENLNDKVYLVADFLSEKPIPCIDCTAVPCYSCTILPFID